MERITIRERITHRHPVWCYFGIDTIPFNLPPCLKYKGADIQILERRNADAELVAEPEAGANGDLEIKVRWNQGFFGTVSYRVDVKAEEMAVDGPFIYFKSVEIDPNPVVMGQKLGIKAVLHNCGSKPLESKYDPPRADYVLAVRELEYLNRVTGNPTGEIILTSDYPVMERMFSQRVDLDIPPGEDFTIEHEEEVPSTDEIDGWGVIRNHILGSYRTRFVLESIDLESPAPNTLIASSDQIYISISE